MRVTCRTSSQNEKLSLRLSRLVSVVMTEAHNIMCIVTTVFKLKADKSFWRLYNSFRHCTCNTNTMGCPPVRGDNPRALASGLSYVQVYKYGITILYHLYQCRPSSEDPEGVRTPPPTGKSQVIWVSIGNKQLDLPWKKLDALWNFKK